MSTRCKKTCDFGALPISVEVALSMTTNKAQGQTFQIDLEDGYIYLQLFLVSFYCTVGCICGSPKLAVSANHNNVLEK